MEGPGTMSNAVTERQRKVLDCLLNEHLAEDVVLDPSFFECRQAFLLRVEGESMKDAAMVTEAGP